MVSDGIKVDRPSRRIVLTSFGSLGDLHPYIALAQGLKARGHDVVIATFRHYQQRVESRGIGFHAVRPHGPDPEKEEEQELARRIMDPRKGGEFIIRDFLMPALRESYEDTMKAARGADLLVSHLLTYTTRLVAEQQGIPWVSSYLQPLCFVSAIDPPVFPLLPFLSKFRFLGPTFHRALFRLIERSCRAWCQPWHRLRAEIGLPTITANPLFEGFHSPSLILAMFSAEFAAKQTDWPQQTVLTGFPISDWDSHAELPPAVARYLDAGSPPVVFTLGSSSAMDPGPFFERSAAAAQLLGRRAILVLGRETPNPPTHLPEGVVAFDYVPFAALFPRASAVVNAGGIGTIGLAMHSGCPMLAMPCAHDQFDNAARVTRLGIARTITRHKYTPARVANELRQLLDTPSYTQRATEIATRLRPENGVSAACDAIEGLLSCRTEPPSLLEA